MTEPEITPPSDGSAPELVPGDIADAEHLSLDRTSSTDDGMLSAEVEGWTIKGLDRVPETDWSLLVQLLEFAVEAKKFACPLLSDYPVGVAGSMKDGTLADGCNLEYGAGFGKADATALHAEEAMVANGVRKGLHPERNPLVYVATTGSSDTPIPACGNCVDILKTFSTEETLFVTEYSNKRAAILTYEEAMPSQFVLVSERELSTEERQALDLAIKMMDRGFDVFTQEELGRTGAAILTESGKLYPGARRDRADFHSLSSMSAAIDHANSAGDPFPLAVAFAADRGYLRGRERQGIYELANAVDKQDSIPVLIYHAELNVIMRATPRELLPYSFGAVDLGMAEEVSRFMADLRAED